MLTGRILDWAATVPGGVDGLADDLVAERSRGTTVEDPARPASIPMGRWRRMSRFARLTALPVVELRERHPDLDWAGMPMVQGSAMGEVVPSSDFLDRLFTEGPDRASPTNFQNSVYNATGAHLSLVFGLKGPAETVSSGMATGLACLARGLEWLDRFEHVLIVAGDDVNRTTSKALSATGPAGDVVVAALLTRGAQVQVRDGVHPATFARAVAMPYERDLQVQDGRRPEACVGITCANGLLALLATGDSVLDQDDAYGITASFATP